MRNKKLHRLAGILIALVGVAKFWDFWATLWAGWVTCFAWLVLELIIRAIIHKPGEVLPWM